jgi:HAE1 family hydrophobic/amphiphilic exporter-1
MAFMSADTDAPPPAHVGVTAARQLTLREAVEMAIRENLDVEIERTNEAGAKAALEGAQGFTDLDFRWNPGYQERAAPAPSLLEAANGRLTEHYDTQNFYLHEQSPWNGASFDVAFENNRISSENPFLGVNPFYTSQLTVSFIQPLWRNREIDNSRATLRIRAKQTELSRTELEIKAIEVIARVEQAYWDLAAARQNAEVQGESVELAGKQLDRDRNRIEAGTLAQVEYSESEAERARREDLWYASEALVVERENALKQLLARSRGAEIWNQELVPSDGEALASADGAGIAALVAQAVKTRPELKGIAVRQQITGIEKKQNENLVKPQVNLVGSYSLAGLAGKLNTAPDPITASLTPIVTEINGILVPLGEPAVTPPTLGTLPGRLVGGYGTNLENLFDGRYQSVQAGLQVDLTFRNRAAQAAVEQSAIAERREKLEQARTEQAIEAQVRDAVESLAIARQRRAAAEVGARAAREKLESETRLFENGESTNFLALTRQNEYSEARRRLLVATLEYNKAVSRLRQATGTTLADNHVDLK